MVRRRAFSRTQHTLAHRLHTQRTLYVSEIGRDMSWLAGGEYPKQTGCRSYRTIIIFCLFLGQLINLIWWCLRHFCSYGTQEYWVRRKHTTSEAVVGAGMADGTAKNITGSGIYCIGPSAHRPTVVVKTARGFLNTNQTHERLVLHNLTQVMTYCCPVKTHVDWS